MAISIVINDPADEAIWRTSPATTRHGPRLRLPEKFLAVETRLRSLSICRDKSGAWTSPLRLQRSRPAISSGLSSNNDNEFSSSCSYDEDGRDIVSRHRRVARSNAVLHLALAAADPHAAASCQGSGTNAARAAGWFHALVAMQDGSGDEGQQEPNRAHLDSSPRPAGLRLGLSLGRAETHGVEYNRHGTLSLYAALRQPTISRYAASARVPPIAPSFSATACAFAQASRSQGIGEFFGGLKAKSSPRAAAP